MGDWEDDDFEPALPTLTQSKTFEEEVDEVEVDPVVTAKAPTASDLARRAQKIADEEERLAQGLKFALQEGESTADRKARERRAIEEADHELTEELLGGGAKSAPRTASGSSVASSATLDPTMKKLSTASLGSSSSAGGGLAAISLSTKQDHTNFGITCSKKLSESTPIYVCSFFKALCERLPAKMTTESLDEILAVLQKVREEKKKVEGEVAKQTLQKKSKKEIKALEKKHADVFGGSFKDDPYADLEDTFM